MTRQRCKVKSWFHGTCSDLHLLGRLVFCHDVLCFIGIGSRDFKGLLQLLDLTPHCFQFHKCKDGNTLWRVVMLASEIVYKTSNEERFKGIFLRILYPHWMLETEVQKCRWRLQKSVQGETLCSHEPQKKRTSEKIPRPTVQGQRFWVQQGWFVAQQSWEISAPEAG